jgi:hypothetical protein
VADFYAARSATITPLPWQSFAPPFPRDAVYPDNNDHKSLYEALALVSVLEGVLVRPGEDDVLEFPTTREGLRLVAPMAVDRHDSFKGDLQRIGDLLLRIHQIRNPEG